MKETQPYPTTPAVQEHEDVAHKPQKNPQKASQRRKDERRQENTPVLLDTRSGHDRRNAADPQNADTDDDNPKSTGIDIYT